MITYDIRYPKWDTILQERIAFRGDSASTKRSRKYVLLGPAVPVLTSEDQVFSVENASNGNITGIVREYVNRGRSRGDVIELLSRAGLDKHKIFIGKEYDRIKACDDSKSEFMMETSLALFRKMGRARLIESNCC